MNITSNVRRVVDRVREHVTSRPGLPTTTRRIGTPRIALLTTEGNLRNDLTADVSDLGYYYTYTAGAADTAPDATSLSVAIRRPNVALDTILHAPDYSVPLFITLIEGRLERWKLGSCSLKHGHVNHLNLVRVDPLLEALQLEGGAA